MTHQLIPLLILAGLASSPARAIVVAAGDPNAHLIPGSNTIYNGLDLSGVVYVVTDFGSCSGALLPDGYSVLTAGHCVAPSFGQPNFNNPHVFFQGPANNGPGTGGYVSIDASAIFVNPGWSGDATLGADIAVMRLAQLAPGFAARYSLYTGFSPSDPVTLAGFGYGGNGNTGADFANYPINASLRVGTNTYVADGTALGWSANMLIGQFYDAGRPGTNAMNSPSPYTAPDEVDIAPGDSGGPTFYNGQLIGVHDVVACLDDPLVANACAVPPAITPAVGSYFGELFGDTSVAAHASWIVQQEIPAVPEPSTAWLLAGGAGLAFSRRAIRRR